MDYSRQELVIGKKAQKKLENSTVSIIGVGALGSLTASLLVRSGVKNLKIFDRDFVEESNLQRQHLFSFKDIGKPKVKIAKQKLLEINPKVKIEEFFGTVNFTNISKVKADLILDCTDNMQTRFLLNDYCSKNKIPCIFSSGVQQKGYVFSSIPSKPCYGCIFYGLKSIDNCETIGVLNTVTSLISSIQVNEAIKYLIGKKVENNLIHFNLEYNYFNSIKVNKRKECLACHKKYQFLEGKKYSDLCKI